MSRVAVIVNSLTDEGGNRAAAEQAVREVLAHRTGDWTISLIDRHDDSSWVIIVAGPDGRSRTWTFGRSEHDASIVKATLERDLGQTMLPMGWRSTWSDE
jgi:hypothetical protein